MGSGQLKPETAVGYNVGLHAGVQYLVTNWMGLVADVGWTHRGMGVTLRGGNAKTEIEGDSDQFPLNAGVVFVL